MVDPRAHRRGITTALLDGLDVLEPAGVTVVCTGTANHPAIALYRSRGFVPTGKREIARGVTLTLLKRNSDAAPPPARAGVPR